jgi:hypothetical protein
LFVLQKTIPAGIFRPASGYDNEEILVWKTGFWEDLFVPLLKDYFLLKTIREKWLFLVGLESMQTSVPLKNGSFIVVLSWPSCTCFPVLCTNDRWRKEYGGIRTDHLFSWSSHPSAF